jgi:hypothetical protein
MDEREKELKLLTAFGGDKEVSASNVMIMIALALIVVALLSMGAFKTSQ